MHGQSVKNPIRSISVQFGLQCSILAKGTSSTNVLNKSSQA